MGFQRHRFVVYVVVGEKRDQGLQACGRCVWDARTDNFVTVTYENASLFVIANVYGIYYEQCLSIQFCCCSSCRYSPGREVAIKFQSKHHARCRTLNMQTSCTLIILLPLEVSAYVYVHFSVSVFSRTRGIIIHFRKNSWLVQFLLFIYFWWRRSVISNNYR